MKTDKVLTEITQLIELKQSVLSDPVLSKDAVEYLTLDIRVLLDAKNTIINLIKTKNGLH